MPLPASAVALLAFMGLIAGVVLGLLTDVLAASGPSGDGWSLKGNGALIVPFGLGPAVLAAGWAALVAHFKSMPNWAAVGLAAGLVGVALVVISLLILVIAGPSGAAIANAVTVLNLIWMFAAPIAVSLLPSPGPSPGADSGPSHLVAAAALPVALVAGLYLALLVIPPGT